MSELRYLKISGILLALLVAANTDAHAGAWNGLDVTTSPGTSSAPQSDGRLAITLAAGPTTHTGLVHLARSDAGTGGPDLVLGQIEDFTVTLAQEVTVTTESAADGVRLYRYRKKYHTERDKVDDMRLSDFDFTGWGANGFSVTAWQNGLALGTSSGDISSEILGSRAVDDPDIQEVSTHFQSTGVLFHIPALESLTLPGLPQAIALNSGVPVTLQIAATDPTDAPSLAHVQSLSFDFESADTQQAIFSSAAVVPAPAIIPTILLLVGLASLRRGRNGG